MKENFTLSVIAARCQLPPSGELAANIVSRLRGFRLQKTTASAKRPIFHKVLL